MMVKPRRCCDRHVRSRRMEPGRNWGVWDMHVGLTMFPTDYAVPPHDLAVAAEARGYDSLWLPEHSHIPTSRKSPWPGGAELPKYYYDTYDPFLSLAAAAAVTKKIKLATGICLVVERDPIHTAKEVSTIDRLSGGRFIFGIGGGCTHAAKRAIAYGDGWIPIGGRSDPLDVLPQFRQMAKVAGRDPASLSFDVFGAPREPDTLKRYRESGVDRAIFMLPPKPRDAILPMLDEGAALVTALQA